MLRSCQEYMRSIRVCQRSSLVPRYCREEFERVLTGRHFAFSLLVHTDKESPMIDFLDASSVLQVQHILSPVLQSPHPLCSQLCLMSDCSEHA